MAWTSLCELDELTEGIGRYVEIDGFQLAVFLDHGNLFVMDNTCPHAGGNLSAGAVKDGCVHCPWHFWGFDLSNGQLRDAPGVAVTTYRTRLFPRESQPTLVQADLPIY